jgi:Cys-tRNA(Pro)/Cys-tRNA(Cys) deacylase
VSNPITAIAQAIVTLLDSHGVDYVLHEHIAVRTIADAEALVPELTENLLKTIAFEINGTPRVVLAAVAAQADVDYKRLAGVAGCNRRALRLMPAARVEAELGFELGGLGPFSLQPHVEIIIDDVLDLNTIVRCGAGKRTRTVELPLGALVRISGARRAAISQAD